MTLTKEEGEYQAVMDRARSTGRPISVDEIHVSAQRVNPELFTPFSPLVKEDAGDRMLKLLEGGSDGPDK
jgi:hypothetical protein